MLEEDSGQKKQGDDKMKRNTKAGGKRSGREEGGGNSYVLFKETAGVQQIVQAAFGLGRLKVTGGLDPFTVIDD